MCIYVCGITITVILWLRNGVWGQSFLGWYLPWGSTVACFVEVSTTVPKQVCNLRIDGNLFLQWCML